jgi:hypothetical protein
MKSKKIIMSLIHSRYLSLRGWAGVSIWFMWNRKTLPQRLIRIEEQQTCCPILKSTGMNIIPLFEGYHITYYLASEVSEEMGLFLVNTAISNQLFTITLYQITISSQV